MREADRSQLRKLLVIWAAAGIAGLIGCCAALAIFTSGLIGVVQSFTSNHPNPGSLVAMVLGCGLQGAFAVLIVGVRGRFEDRCWELIHGDAAWATGDSAGALLLGKQADGRDDRLAALRVLRSQRFAKRLKVLIDRAWPR